jgi:hypothetical protein
MRRFQFRLRTLLIGVTLLAVPMGYVGWQVKIVRERKEELRKITNDGGLVGFWDVATPPWPTELRTVPFVRRWIGDRAVLSVMFKKGTANEERQRIKELFPEGVFFVSSEVLDGEAPATKP